MTKADLELLSSASSFFPCKSFMRFIDFILCVVFACVYVCASYLCLVLEEVRIGHQIP